MGALINFLLDPAAVITVVSGAAAFMALLGVLMPYLRPDPMRGRLKATTERRRDLRAQRVEALQRRSKLRRARPNWVRDLVDRMKIRDLFAQRQLETEAAPGQLAQSQRGCPVRLRTGHDAPGVRRHRRPDAVRQRQVSLLDGDEARHYRRRCSVRLLPADHPGGQRDPAAAGGVQAAFPTPWICC